MTENTPKTAQDMTYKHKRVSATRIFKRIGFYIVSFIVLVLLIGGSLDSSSETTVPGYGNLHLGGLMLASYLSTTLIFPFRKNKWSTALGLTIAVVGAFTSHFFLGLIVAGIIALLIDLFQRGWLYYSGWMLSVVGIVGFSLFNPYIGAIFPYRLLPLWFYLFSASVLVLGFCPAILKPLENIVPERFRFWPKAVSEVMGYKTLAPHSNSTGTPIAEGASETEGSLLSLNDIERHRAVLMTIKSQLNRLPKDFIELINNIMNQTELILENMQKDSLDVLPGNRFLNRYLPIVQSTVDGLAKLNIKNSEHFDELKEEARQALNSLSTAFTQMHHQLLQNDVDDLMVDLKVVDKLLKSEGFDR